MFLLLVVLLSITVGEVSCYSFNGTWQLDKSISESPNEILKLMGVAMFKRNIMNNLDITMTYTLFGDSVKIEKVTAWSNEASVYLFGRNETKEDLIMGAGTHVTTFHSGALYYVFIRNDDDTGTYNLVNELIDAATMRITIRYTLPYHSQSATCIRYFKKTTLTK